MIGKTPKSRPVVRQDGLSVAAWFSCGMSLMVFFFWPNRDYILLVDGVVAPKQKQIDSEGVLVVLAALVTRYRHKIRYLRESAKHHPLCSHRSRRLANGPI